MKILSEAKLPGREQLRMLHWHAPEKAPRKYVDCISASFGMDQPHNNLYTIGAWRGYFNDAMCLLSGGRRSLVLRGGGRGMRRTDVIRLFNTDAPRQSRKCHDRSAIPESRHHDGTAQILSGRILPFPRGDALLRKRQSLRGRQLPESRIRADLWRRTRSALPDPERDLF